MSTTRGVITFSFDDGYSQTYENVLPILNQHEMPGVFALPLNSARVEAKEGRSIRPWSAWLDLTKHGHEIAAHSINHVDLTKITAEQLTQELAEPVQKLAAKTLVYPGGAHNDNVRKATAQHYSAARSLVRGLETTPPTDPYKIRSFDFTRRNFRVWKANLLAIWAVVSNKWLVETFHIVDNSEHEKEHTISTDDFARHVAFVSKLPIAVKTIQQVIEL
ncbi:MAG: polysaccharide deacetylase family protein [Candidatus Andersenbacteria bacterium]|nr:polysaccharide deacetylase family protein [Candidatus Andersenbacteria bacterium]MBI3250270.1 polysaccharide deacetylase family protein [Candidatus Andersenbacteria bacterium]